MTRVTESDMPLNFSFNKPLVHEPAPRGRRKVLVTGASGDIGSYFAEHSHERYDLRLMVRPKDDGKSVDKFGEVVKAELSDLPTLKEICRGVDTVVHLAADPSPSATWDSLIESNIRGHYHMCVAAKAAGCRRLVYASSIHAISGYRADVQVKATDPVNPGDLYGVSKCFAEALCRYMAEQEGLSCIAVRIGAFQPREKAKQEEAIDVMMDAFVSRRDLTQLLQKCVDDETLRFAIVHGLSDNRFKRMDISSGRELLGYQPQDDFTELNEELRKLDLNDVASHSAKRDQGKSGLRNDL